MATQFKQDIHEAADAAYLRVASSMQNSTEPTLLDGRLAAETGGVAAGGLAIWGGKVLGRRTAPKESPELKKATEAKAAAEKKFSEASAKRAAFDSKVNARIEAANRDIAAAKKSGDSAALKRAQDELAKAEKELKKIENKPAYKKAVAEEQAAKKAQAAARGNYTKVLQKHPPQPGSKLLPRGVKAFGWVAAGASAISFADHLIDYLVEDRSFYHTDENGNRVLLDPKVLTAGSQSAGSQVLFDKGGAYDAMSRVMAFYAAKHGLGTQVTQAQWQHYLVHMGEGTEFTMESEVQLRQTLLKAYQQLSTDDKLKVLDEFIAEQDDPQIIAALTKLKTEVETEERAKENAPQREEPKKEKEGGASTKKPAERPTPTSNSTKTGEPAEKTETAPKRKRGGAKGTRPRGSVKGSRPKPQNKEAAPEQANATNTLRGAGYDISGQTTEMGQTRTSGGRGGMA